MDDRIELKDANEDTSRCVADLFDVPNVLIPLNRYLKAQNNAEIMSTTYTLAHSAVSLHAPYTIYNA